jgi:hypothetical protein
MMIHYFYYFDYNLQVKHKSGHSDKSETDGDVLTTHAKVYALAEKYLIRGLKAVALRKFKAAAAVCSDVDDFLQATLEVYTSTIEDERGLRDVVVETLFKNSEWLDKEKVRAVIKELGALTYDLVIYMRQHRRF